jgi:hypothetical protein
LVVRDWSKLRKAWRAARSRALQSRLSDTPLTSSSKLRHSSPLSTRVYISLTLAAATMATPALLGRNATQTFRRQIHTVLVPRRGLAAVASGSFQYETGNAAGVKFASRDLPGPTTTLTVVAKAGTRYQILPGYSDALEKFAFKVSTFKSLSQRLRV